jgi:microsomal dipeptidase-like Zn-dependent dipeptidase
MYDEPATASFPGLTDIHAHPAMNAFLWDRDLRRHYFTAGGKYCPLASLSDFKMLRKGEVDVLWSSLHVPEPDYLRCPPIRLLAHVTKGGRKLLKLNSWQCLQIEMEEMERQVERAEGFALARSNAELDRVRSSCQRAIIHTVEGGHVLGAGLAASDRDGRLERLGELAAVGVASLTIAHLFPNELAGHAKGIPDNLRKVLFLWELDSKVDPDRGLTPLGAEVVEEMVRLRIVPDVAHCTPTARRQIYELVDNRIPVIASHVGVKTINDVPYNLDQDDVRAIAASGGVVGVIFMPYWLHEDNPGKGRDAIWATMETLRDWTGGWQHMALGTDFDGFTDPADDFNSAAKLHLVRRMLEANRVLGADLEAVLGGNARRVLRTGWR